MGRRFGQLRDARGRFARSSGVRFVKRHRGKIIAGAVIIGAGAGGYAAGHRRTNLKAFSHGRDVGFKQGRAVGLAEGRAHPGFSTVRTIYTAGRRRGIHDARMRHGAKDGQIRGARSGATRVRTWDPDYNVWRHSGGYTPAKRKRGR